jgi:hypothetical protein
LSVIKLASLFFQRLNLQNGGPVCHRKIPSVHTLNITEAKPHNKTDGFLVPAYSEISRVWPELAPENLQYKIRQLAPGIQFYFEIFCSNTRLVDNNPAILFFAFIIYSKQSLKPLLPLTHPPKNISEIFFLAIVSG